MSNQSRKYTSKLLELLADGSLDPMEVLSNALNFMSESDVQEFCELNDYDEQMGFKEEEDDEDCLFEVGDLVITNRGETGTVVHIEEDCDDEYPVHVKFDIDSDVYTYTNSGVYNKSRKNDMMDITKK